jgi:hypothetical protein
MKNFICALAVLATPALFAANPEVTLTPTEVVVRVAPHAYVAYTTSSSGPTARSSSSAVREDIDGDGVIRIARIRTSP